MKTLNANILALALIVAAACGDKEDDTQDTPDTQAEAEGSYAGECSDGADNDADGATDCDDTDCQGTDDCPECENPGADYDGYADDYLPVMCGKMQECDLLNAYFTYEDCMALADAVDTGEPFECEDFDCYSAEQCLLQVAAVSCEDFSSGQGIDACNEVCSNL